MTVLLLGIGTAVGWIAAGLFMLAVILLDQRRSARLHQMTPPAPPAPARPPDYWADLDAFANAAPQWPRVVASPVWQRDLAPWLRRLLWESMGRLTCEANPETVRSLQVRCLLLDGLIQQPDREIARMNASLENRFQSGGLEEEDTRTHA